MSSESSRRARPDAPRLFIKTYGCQMNEYDSEKMAAVLERSHGYQRTKIAEEADLLLLNTCSIREKAQEKVFSEIGRWKDWKDADPGRRIGLGGCVASQEGDALVERAPLVDLIFGPQTLHRLPEMLEQSRSGSAPVIDVSFPEIEKFDRLPEPRAEGATAFVSIMEGCSKYCTFCVVPYTRGEEISRPLDDALRECRSLVDQGVKEITLLGQNVNAYRGPAAGGSPGETCDLALLIDHLAAFDGLERIRFFTSHPKEFGDALIDSFATQPKLASYLHLPVQSGSDRILAMMKRGHSRAQYLDKIRRVKEARPGLSLSTDFIVGFPTETDADFQATLELIDEAGFDCAFSFAYSARPGTPAANLRDVVPDDVKQERLQRLQQRIRERDQAFLKSLVGTRQELLVEGASERGGGQLKGRASCHRTINFDGPESLIGRMAGVQVTEALRNSLRGRLAA